MKIIVLLNISSAHFNPSRFFFRLTSSSAIVPTTKHKSPTYNNEPTAESIRPEFLRMLNHFRYHRPYQNERYLRLATYFAWKTGLEREFVDVADEWFRQARLPVFDRPDFKVTSNLCNLGKLNIITDGKLVEKLRWSSIDYLIYRMAEIGFRRFHAEDIASAASGLQYLVQIRSPSDRRRNEERRVAPIFVVGLKQYLSGKGPGDDDWRYLIGVTAPFYLNVFSYIFHDRPPSMDVMIQLCRLSKLGFERISKKEKRLGAQDVKSLGWFGRAFLRQWKIGADAILVGSWSSWYRACAAILEASDGNAKIKNQVSFQFLRELIAVAETYDQIPNFWPLLQPWQRCVSNLCQNASNLESDTSLETVEHQLVNLVFTSGQLAIKCGRERWKVDECARSFRALLPLFELALTSRHYSNLDPVSQCRWLTGIRDIRKELTLPYELSESYFAFLRDWCVFMRSQKEQPPNLAMNSALLLHLFREMKLHHRVPSSTLEELVRLCFFALDTSTDNLMKNLTRFSTSLANYTFKLDEIGRKKYFDKVFLALGKLWDPKSTKDAALFLSSISQLVYTQRMFNDWTQIQDIYEKRTSEMVDHFTPKQVHFLISTFPFDASLRKKLAPVAALYVRKDRT